MAVDLHASDPAFSGVRRVGEGVEELVAFAQTQLGGDWRVISSRMKMQKTFFEAEYNGRRVIGKVSKSKRAEAAYSNLSDAWQAGMRPPSRYTVTEPIAWLPERKLLIQEKAPGSPLIDLAKLDGNGKSLMRDAAAWLQAIWTADISVSEDRFDVAAVEQRAAELGSAMNDHRIQRLAREAADHLDSGRAECVPSHGDYHPMNVFISPDRVTAIDFDTLAGRRKEVDVAYFLAQFANLGLHVFGSFEATEELRSEFLSACGPLDHRRISAYMAWTLLRSLHYDLCILKIRNEAAESMIRASETLLRTGAVELRA